ncbi:MAG TPA: nitroreductase family protein [Anaerolineae bacterium]|nr:nitroreductase family protein [Anaerolineae bacterium]
MTNARFTPLTGYVDYSSEEMAARAAAFYADIRRRRTVRDYSDRPVPREVIEQCLLAAGRAPSGANLQPWHFAVVSNPAVKRQIREAAESPPCDLTQARTLRTM